MATTKLDDIPQEKSMIEPFQGSVASIEVRGFRPRLFRFCYFVAIRGTLSRLSGIAFCPGRHTVLRIKLEVNYSLFDQRGRELRADVLNRVLRVSLRVLRVKKVHERSE